MKNNIKDQQKSVQIKEKVKTKIYPAILLVYGVVACTAIVAAISMQITKTSPAKQEVQIIVQAPTLKEAQTQLMEAVKGLDKRSPYEGKIEEILNEPYFENYITSGKVPSQNAPSMCTNCGKFGFGTCYDYCLGGSINPFVPSITISLRIWF